MTIEKLKFSHDIQDKIYVRGLFFEKINELVEAINEFKQINVLSGYMKMCEKCAVIPATICSNCVPTPKEEKEPLIGPCAPDDMESVRKYIEAIESATRCFKENYEPFRIKMTEDKIGNHFSSCCKCPLTMDYCCVNCFKRCEAVSPTEEKECTLAPNCCFHGKCICGQCEDQKDPELLPCSFCNFKQNVNVDDTGTGQIACHDKDCPLFCGIDFDNGLIEDLECGNRRAK